MASDHSVPKSGDAKSTSRWPGGRKFWAIALAGLLLAAWAGMWLFHRWVFIYVDDARIDGEIVTIASRVSGWITEFPLIEGDPVRKGQLIARIDDRDALLQREALVSRLRGIESQMAVLRAQTGQVDEETSGKLLSESNRLAAAEAEVASFELQLKQARDDYKRAQDVERFLTQQEVDRARTTYQQIQESHRKAQAEVAAARGLLSAAGGSRRQLQVIGRQLAVLEHQAAELRAQLGRQDVDLADRAIVSPGDGYLVMTFVRAGEHVASGQRIAMFHDPRQIWVEANVKETDVGSLRLGMKAQVRVDAYPGKVYDGEIYRIGQAATSKFALLPDPNPSGNFTKITQRLPVRIKLTETDPALRPGMMVEVDIDPRDH
jgi:membrane fusion protein (multidrug efflux system)